MFLKTNVEFVTLILKQIAPMNGSRSWWRAQHDGPPAVQTLLRFAHQLRRESSFEKILAAAFLLRQQMLFAVLFIKS